ncbi:bifunctional proline dehydrogenase/pyrroline-5-carboxylate dehydrogenase [Azotobacter vinelandii CA]|uniref:Bifunctional protein PutA n=2 Tax=Azotobacter vinelandii TaxID=354 RepID=C1DQT9_AZOVD|nr:bifunctional proline dehydrogenase/L-glutamate gamma-semialdehyde dehydrogenase PutA [Azotobacter vinelandii]ACO77612.1 Proline dehydrogenase, PutA [Azotobacter vinelandii DJ]AGK13068.1 bifunctional proline dehydrogenase/pyrroline-5-carboxylate dehydrogenase [Azotobacter vinelandii CA]AGK18603.1 bifunctional proline dehydrogenase/pyrroline-5-carboxylate dehydrogenase [Azotobacter vinelandii CA6]SFX98305.1 L-proline dehydrogenase /delta-1-pyrroline-5-carboxylate dehydrogenase [Azotobacter vin
MFKASRVLQGNVLDTSAGEFFPFISANYCVDEAAWLNELLPLADPGEAGIAAIRERAGALIEAVRRRGNVEVTLDALLREYSLDTQEGLMLMCLAEALLRVPDPATAEALIRDKLSAAQWAQHLGHSDNLLVNFAAWGLLMTGRLVSPESSDGRPKKVIGRLLQRSGEPVIRAALNQAMKLMGNQFVLGRNIAEALRNARRARERGYGHSFDMLGEAALTEAAAERFLTDYRLAIEALGREPQVGGGPRPSISIKLSALHPRYEAAQRRRVLAELFASVRELAELARSLNVGITIDAEEADRLELSLELFEKLLCDPAIRGWGEFGLVVQAYSKRALPVLVWLTLLGRELDTRIPVRLVKGAYWDSEIKQCQVQGLEGYPVFTRKEGTDTSYLACARYLLGEHCRGVLYPQFATHNAHTVSCILAMAETHPPHDFEFQRLYGMGDALYDCLLERQQVQVRIYAPVGEHRELLPYLVRRLLENGANSSFVHRLVDPRIPVEALIGHPVEQLRRCSGLANPRIPLPVDIHGAGRKNSRGINLNVRSQWEPFERALRVQLEHRWQAAPLVDGQVLAGEVHEVRSPQDLDRVVGTVWFAGAELVDRAMARLAAAWPRWNATPMERRAAIFGRLADLLEEHRTELVALCILEAGKTIQDSLDEVREAVDFCRYYAQQARLTLKRTELRGPTGERNELFYEGRGLFVCISPWNFPLAIYLGQIVAALVAGNCVLAKPAEQTSLIAARALELLFAAGLPKEAIAFLPGDGPALGAACCADPHLAGVCFTGSTETARLINRRLAWRDGPLVTLIAETGGQNVMIVDSTALPEQVVKDALHSAFTSAGQRCSALRVLYLQNEIAGPVIELLRGAMAELRVGLPQRRDTDVGPLIDTQARQALLEHVDLLKGEERLLAEAGLAPALNGHFLAPLAFEIGGIGELRKEHFGPILHVVRYAAEDLEQVVAAINASGYGLTLGVHSRNEATARRIEALTRVGNLYVNRNQIGAVVGVQPFGGCGLSGTGPKAGGPNYLLRFVHERSTAINTAAVGGNASLLSLTERE